MSFAQQKAITGEVIEESTGESLPGVTIVVKGTSQGTITDFDGHYSIPNVEQGTTLIFSFVGMLTQEIVVGNQTSIDVTMKADAIGLGLVEVIAIGYGTQKKRTITSAIDRVNKEDFNQGPVTSSAMQLVQGKVAGLMIQRVNSDPNRDVSIQLRGVSTVSGSSQPLIIIDGIPGGNLNSIAPEDIESIDVLKDGSAASIYGTRGSNGVIIVTTKKGKEGKMRVEYSGYVTFEKVQLPDLLSGDEYRNLAQEFANSGNPTKEAKASSMMDFGSDTDWLGEMTRDPFSMVHHISVSGGNKTTTYSGSLNYQDTEGVLKRSDRNMLRSHLSVAHSALEDRLNISFNLSATTGEYTPADYGLYSQALKRNPTMPVYNEDGTFHETYGWDEYNPVGLIYQIDKDNKVTELLGSTRMSYEIVPGLTAAVIGAIQKHEEFNGYYDQKESSFSVPGGYEGRANRGFLQSMDRTLETTLNFSKLINEVHRFDILGGYSYQDFTNEGFFAENSSFITDQYSYNNLGAGDYLLQGKASMASHKNESTLIAFLGRAIYSYQDKYLMTAGVRREGSSKFGENNKWGWFPSLSLGWRITEEDFMKDISWLDDIKLRAGYGVTGNQGTGPYASLVRLRPGARMYYNGSWVPGVEPASNPNPDLGWETKSEINFGIDMTVLNNRLSANIDVYRNITKDLIYSYSVPTPPNIYSETITNVGEIRNSGIEFTVNAIPVQEKDFQWNINCNLSYNDNELVSLSNEQYPFEFKDILMINSLGLSNVTTYRLEEGQPIGNMFGYMFAGFTDEGKWLVYNKEGEKIPVPQATPDDKDVMGNGLPKINAGLTNTFRYKNFDLSFMFRGVFGFDIYNLVNLTHENAFQLPLNILDSGVDSELFDVPSYNSYYVEKGDFVKLDNVTFGYSFKVNREVIKKARVYFTGQNLYTFTNYSGVDPEVDINGLGPGFDGRFNYPRTTSFTFGINLTF